MQQSQQNEGLYPVKLASKGGEIRYNWAVKDFERLSDLLLNDSGAVKVHIEGLFDHQKRCLLKTRIQADLTLECQTTFEAIEFKLDRNVTFCSVTSEEQFAQVEKEFEPVMAVDGWLDIKQIIEDELILSLPVVANKPADELKSAMQFGHIDEGQADAEKAKANPFSVLSDFRKND